MKFTQKPLRSLNAGAFVPPALLVRSDCNLFHCKSVPVKSAEDEPVNVMQDSDIFCTLN